MSWPIDSYVFIAVRMKSSRLKKKALLSVNGEPLILSLVKRLSAKIPKDKIVVCTSTYNGDDALEEICISNDIKYYRGDELDVMGRFICAAEKNGAKTIVRVTGDNPLTDPDILIKMLRFHDATDSEYTCTYDIPVGTRSEIINSSSLKRIHQQLTSPESSEYMTLMLNRPDKLKVCVYDVEDENIKRPELSVTVDTSKDLSLVNDIYYGVGKEHPSLCDIIDWIDKHPESKIICGESELHDSIDCSYITD